MIEIFLLDKKNYQSVHLIKFYLPSKNINILVWSNKTLEFFNQFQFLQTKSNSLLGESRYYVRLCKTLLDRQAILNNEKVPSIPLLLHQDKFIIDFKEKADAFCYFLLDSLL